MSFLSQALVSTTDALRESLSDGYRWHRAIWGAFPDRPEAKRDFLFRVDHGGASIRVLVLSPRMPASLPWLTWRMKEILPGFLGHAAYRFQCRANPTMRRCADRRRLGIYGEDRLLAWMERKAELSGFRIHGGTLSCTAPTDEVFLRNGRPGKHVAVDFAGVLDVVERQRFLQTFEKGIGAAKSFGFGLLMLEPLDTSNPRGEQEWT
jgi:CRISPR system Cascade subunit CasE